MSVDPRCRPVGRPWPDGRGMDVDYLIAHDDPDCGAPPGSALAAARRAVRRLGWEPKGGFSPVPDPRVTVIGGAVFPTWLVEAWRNLPARAITYECECCDLPLCAEKSPGIGYYCERCLEHFCWHQDTARPGARHATHDDYRREVDADHVAMALPTPATEESP